MVERTKLERIAQANAEFKDTLPNVESDEGSSGQFQYTKRKKSQGTNSISNSVSIRDVHNDLSFVVSVTATVKDDKNPKRLFDEEFLSRLQKSITAFLNEVHDEI